VEKLLSKSLFRKWLHSYEEDYEDVQVFRPNDFGFPPSRMPRDGYRFGKDGQVTRYIPGPTDALDAVEGRFRQSGDSMLALYFAHEAIKGFSISIIYCDEKSLKIKTIGENR
jgi:hypothetical protein